MLDSTALRHRKNIVGYTQKTSVSGFNWLAPMFNSVGVNTVSLKDISISDGGAGGIGWGTEILQTLDDGGAVVSNYFYNDPAMDPAGEQTGYYWADETGAPVDVNFSMGEGFLLYTASGDINYTVAGEVPEEAITLTSVAGFNFTGNPFPSALPLSNIVISDGGAGGIGWGTEIIQTLDDGGAVVDNYFFNDPAMDPNGEQTDYYWADETGAQISVSLQPGDGVLLYTASPDLEVTFTPPY